MIVEQFLRDRGRQVLSFSVDTSAVEAARKFGNTIEGKRFSVSIVVDENNRVLGVLSLGDIVHGLAEHGAAIVEKTVRDLMTKSVYAAKPTDTLMDVMKNMAEHEIRHVPVVENGVLKGLVARKDVLEALHGEASYALNSLTEYVYRSGGRY